MAGLFGYTSYYPETKYKPEEWIKPGQGYNFLVAHHQPVYKETKDKFQDLYQPTKDIDIPKDLKSYTINDIGRTMHSTYGLNASYYNG